MNKQHFHLPNNMTKNGKLNPNDLLVYVTIKRFYNAKTKLCFPGLRKISEKCGFSIPTIRKSIKALEDENWIKVHKQDRGRKQFYSFREYDSFEIFSPEFLDNEEISPKEKAYLIAAQQYMYKDLPGIGKMSYTNEQLSRNINLSTSLIGKHDKSLENKGVLSLVPSDNLESGIVINNKFFHLDELGQAIVFTLQKHDNKINEHDQKIKELENTIKKLLKERKLPESEWIEL